MIKLQPPAQKAGAYHNFRCGEVMCNGPASYDVLCALCGDKVAYESFPQHFRDEHLTQVEEECKIFETDTTPEHVETAEQLALKAEDDPIGYQTYEIAEGHVDLEQIALIDEGAELDGNHAFEVIAAAPTVKRKRRAAALKNKLIHKAVELSEVELPLTDIELALNENVDLDWVEHEGGAELLDCDENYDDDDDGNENGVRDMLFQCDQCERAYNTKRSLQGHKRSKHSNKPEDATALPNSSSSSSGKQNKKKRQGTVKTPYKCDECNVTFRTERDMRGHRWKHTGIFCDICGKPFTQSGNMMRHRLRHTGIKPHKCQECDATFYTQKELTSHNICHTGRMPCICEVCGRPCRDRGVLTAHMRRHTGERPAKCDICGKAFYSFHDLNVHAVTHTNLRPFVCDVCGSTFQRKKALRVHKLLHSEQRKYACKLCNKTFAQSGGLNAHMRTHESARAKAKAKVVAAAAAASATIDPELGDTLVPNVDELLGEHIGNNDTEELTISMAVEPASWHV